MIVMFVSYKLRRSINNVLEIYSNFRNAANDYALEEAKIKFSSSSILICDTMKIKREGKFL